MTILQILAFYASGKYCCVKNYLGIKLALEFVIVIENYSPGWCSW
jgi:hypothetical protein